MNNKNFVEEGLRDNDIFELFLDLLNNEKAPEKSIYLDFDLVIDNIKLIKNELDSLSYNEDKEDMYDPIVPVNAKRIESSIYFKYIGNANKEIEANALEDSLIFINNDPLARKNKKYLEYLKNNKEYVESELQKIYNTYIKNAIVLLLEKYLNFFETFGFVRDPIFNKIFSHYIKYVLTIISKIKNYNFIARDRISTALFNIIKPFADVGFGGNVIILMSINSVSTELSNQFKIIKNGDILHLTRGIDTIKLYSTDIIHYEISDQPFFVEKYYQHWLDYTMEITLDSKSQSKMFFSMYLIMQSFENIKGLSCDVYSVRLGSLSSKINVKAKDIVTREEFKTVLRNGSAIAKSMLTDTSFPEIQENYKIDQKVGPEVEETQKQLDSALSPDGLLHKDSLPTDGDDLKKKKLEAEIKLLHREEELKALELKIKEVEYIDKLSQLLASGIVQVDSLNITLNGLPIIIKTGGQLEIGDIDEAIV